MLQIDHDTGQGGTEINEAVVVEITVSVRSAVRIFTVAYGTDKVDGCGLCGRPVERLTRHHLIPRSRHRKKRVKRNFTREQMQRVVLLCPACHHQIHKTFTEKELEQDYNSVEALLGHPDIQRFVSWIEKKPHGVTRKAGRNPGG